MTIFMSFQRLTGRDKGGSARLAAHRLDPNMGGEAAPVKSAVREPKMLIFDLISTGLRNAA
jgi:hypothetical protein